MVCHCLCRVSLSAHNVRNGRHHVFRVGYIQHLRASFLLAESCVRNSRTLLSLSILNIAGAASNVRNSALCGAHVTSVRLKLSGRFSIMWPVSQLRECNYNLPASFSSISFEPDFHLSLLHTSCSISASSTMNLTRTSLTHAHHSCARKMKHKAARDQEASGSRPS